MSVFLTLSSIPNQFSPRHTPAIFNPQLEIGNIGTGNTPTLATLPPRPVGQTHTLARPSGCLRQCSLRGFASSVHVLGEPPGLDASHDITSRATVSMLLYQRGLNLLLPQELGFTRPTNAGDNLDIWRSTQIRQSFNVFRPFYQFHGSRFQNFSFFSFLKPPICYHKLSNSATVQSPMS